MEYLIIAALTAAGYFAIRHFAATGQIIGRTPTYLYIGLGALVLLLLLSALGVFGPAVATTVRPF